MKKLTLLCAALIAALMMTPAASFAQSTKKAKDPAADASTAKTKVAANAPSASAIADAKSKGMVWVNTDSKIYHKDGEFYGNTKKGQFMTEADAQKAGYRAAKTGAVKTKTDKKKS